MGDISKEKEELKKLESKIIEGLTFYYTNYCEEEREIAEERTYRLLEAYTQTLRKESYKEGYDNGAKEGVLED